MESSFTFFYSYNKSNLRFTYDAAYYILYKGATQWQHHSSN